MTPTRTATMTPTLTSTSTATPPAQVFHDDVIQDWFDTSAWSPDPSGTFTDTTLTQTKNQQRNRHTYYTDYLGNVSGDAYPSDYRTVSQTVYGTKPLNTRNVDTVTQNWYDTSGWSPDPSGTFTDTTLTQYKNQGEDHTTYTTNDRGDVYNVGYYTATRTIEQTVYGTRPLNPVNHDDVTRDWYDTSGWSPDPSGTYTDQSLTQYKDQAQDHSTYTTNDRGDRYNEGSYTSTRTISQVVQGTKRLCFSFELYYDGNGRAALTGTYCEAGDASFDTGEGAGTPGDVAWSGCLSDGFNVIHGGYSGLSYC